MKSNGKPRKEGKKSTRKVTNKFWKTVKRTLTHLIKSGKKRKKATTNTQKHDFLRFSQKHIMKMKNQRSQSTISNYYTASRSLIMFLKSRNARHPDLPITLCINEIDSHFIQGYDHWLMERGVSINTRSCYLRSLRAIYNEYPLAKVKKSDPFKDVFTGNAPTTKRAISAKEVKMIEKADITNDKTTDRKKHHSELAKTQDIFLFSLYAMGMAFVDIYHLRRSQVKGNVITYSRHKTGQTVSVRIEPCMKDIFNRHSVQNCDYVFASLHTQDYSSALNQYNRNLKALAKRAGVTSHLTSYVARHTWASLAYKHNIGIPIISQAMGHTNITTTMIYIRQLDNQQIFSANNNLLKALKLNGRK